VWTIQITLFVRDDTPSAATKMTGSDDVNHPVTNACLPDEVEVIQALPHFRSG